jgi:hypothetical protein
MGGRRTLMMRQGMQITSAEAVSSSPNAEYDA